MPYGNHPGYHPGSWLKGLLWAQLNSFGHTHPGEVHRRRLEIPAGLEGHQQIKGKLPQGELGSFSFPLIGQCWAPNGLKLQWIFGPHLIVRFFVHFLIGYRRKLPAELAYSNDYGWQQLFGFGRASYYPTKSRPAEW